MPVHLLLQMFGGRRFMLYVIYSEATIILAFLKVVSFTPYWSGGQHSSHSVSLSLVREVMYPSLMPVIWSLSLYSATALRPAQPHQGVPLPVPHVLQAVRQAAGPRWAAEGRWYVPNAKLQSKVSVLLSPLPWEDIRRRAYYRNVTWASP